MGDDLAGLAGGPVWTIPGRSGHPQGVGQGDAPTGSRRPGGPKALAPQTAARKPVSQAGTASRAAVPRLTARRRRT